MSLNYIWHELRLSHISLGKSYFILRFRLSKHSFVGSAVFKTAKSVLHTIEFDKNSTVANRRLTTSYREVTNDSFSVMLHKSFETAVLIFSRKSFFSVGLKIVGETSVIGDIGQRRRFVHHMPGPVAKAQSSPVHKTEHPQHRRLRGITYKSPGVRKQETVPREMFYS